MATVDPRWNLNVRYHREVLAAIPIGARTALDVGCGDGLLAFDIADRGLTVTAVDIDEASVRRADCRLASEKIGAVAWSLLGT